ncbi:MAG: anthranilate synthase component I family protein, partial [Leptospiraceae bacterium]|nr:anthranilate synthase component I family protein [Leptospiraceae bacterium]
EIKAGNTFQCQIGFKSEFEISGNTLPIYSELRQINPSPHMFYLKFAGNKLIGASPELLFRLRNGEMESFPLAGSIKRGDYAEEDLKLAKMLLNNPKEIAEHNMLVDLHRNDLGRVAKFGTVKVRRLMDIKKFSHIQHISSEVTGIIRKKEDMFSGLATSFPAGTLSGAPKIESMKIIERLENNPRGPYGGALGHFGFNGDCTFAIPIRTLFISENYAYTQASGGIVYDSTPEGEYDEVIRKAAAIEKVLKKFTD